tara:strand:+ start:9881 stop:10093 length:213 start_codon:yes stop_codon:yes gene_type:complete
MQKIINVLAISSFVISAAVVGSGVYVYANKDAIIDGVKSKVMDAVLPDIGGGITDALPDVTGPALPSTPF